MNEEQIDALVFAALKTGAGQELHRWLVNNYLMTPRNTLDPQEALVANAQACLVASLNTRYARHLEKQHDRGEPGKHPGAGPTARAGKRVGEHFKT